MWTTEVRPAVNAGRYGFYPSDAAELRDMLDTFFAEALVPDNLAPAALVAPHAGYVFSGQTAAYAYKTLLGRPIRRAVVLAPSHYAAFPGASIFPGRAFATPFGEVPVDRPFVEELMGRRAGFSFYPEAEQREHALEVQLPFLQYAVGDFELVPIVFYDRSLANCRRIANAIADVMKADPKETIIVASSDLYHGPGAERAYRESSFTAKAITACDPVSFADGVEAGEYMACGAGPVTVAMLLARTLGAQKGTLLKLTTSYEVHPGSEDYVVGYAAIAFSASEKCPD
ncbi:MAG: AmmeMemoRadiSam system protein B [Candidatus Sumerlaeaceae bacterium]|nr:AmmeMemoRadiSam system protein B [Candidatus Sumerlaeaceae bacterium]